MKKIVDFCKKRYKILIPIMVVFVLLITVFYLYKEYKYDSYRNKVEANVYQYFGGIRTDYTAIITYNLKKNIVDIAAKDKKIEFDATPIYYKDTDNILFPKVMNIVFPLMDAKQFRLYKYSNYGRDDENSSYKITNGNNNVIYDHFFLFDGDGLYFFSDEVSLIVDDQEYVKLSPNSFLEVVGGYTLSYYDKEKDEGKMLEVEGKKISIVNDYLDLSLNDNSFKYLGKKVLLIAPDNLKELSFDN